MTLIEYINGYEVKAREKDGRYHIGPPVVIARGLRGGDPRRDGAGPMLPANN